ncbi:MAG: RHS repeat domain-containing protein [Flavobacteriaceae bacterium]
MGTKLEKTVTDGSSVTTEYAGNYVYEGGSLQFFNQSEGYIETDGSGGYDYVYQYKDHLGNIRLSYSDDVSVDGSIDPATEIREENNYYPFGLKHKGYNSTQNGRDHKFEYNGVEFNEDLGLNLMEMDMRQFDPATARFTGVDPVTHYSMSTYTAFDNNPVFWSDPSGANAECPSCETEDDWNAYYSQAEYTALATGQKIVGGMVMGEGPLSSGLDEAGHTLFYFDGKLQDLNRHDNRLDALSSLVADGLMVEAPGKLFKFISGFFKGGGDEVVDDVVDLGARAKQIHSELPAATQSRTTTAVAEVADIDGNVSFVVASSEKRLRPAQRAALNSNEAAAVGTGHAEVTAINVAQSSGQKVLRVGASRPICAGCERAINAAGARAASPLKNKSIPRLFDVDL